MQLNLIRAASFLPHSLQHPNAWIGHTPFANWIMQEVNPRVFVELGTHSGNSYFAFCQAVKENLLTTKCYAVDTWQGDEHAGSYDETVFTEVSEQNQKHYSAFSNLLRMTFDAALTYFSDASIDLLHIDGLHTYDAVRHDFEAWLPKLAPGAIVIFHDINVRERQFGVWQLWEELKNNYPLHLEFVHAYGLGVLQLNHPPQEKKLSWLSGDIVEKNALSHYFATLGKRQLERYELQCTNQIINEHQATINHLNTTLVAGDHTIVELKKSLQQNAQTMEDLKHELLKKDKQVSQLNKLVVKSNEETSRLQQHIDAYQAMVKEILNSTSWQITKPLRSIGHLVRKINYNLFIKKQSQDYETLITSHDFVENFFALNDMRRDQAIRHYLNMWKHDLPQLRKPAPGFNPCLYNQLHHCRKRRVEPFADYIRTGKSTGPWQDAVIVPDENYKNNQTVLPLSRVVIGEGAGERGIISYAIHIHVFYCDVLQDILQRLQCNQTQVDLFISTEASHVDEVVTMLTSFPNQRYTVKIVPNKGRDIGPFLSEFAQALQQYAVIGHFHTKKSMHLKLHEGKAWTNLLFENLLGGQYAMVDCILEQFQQNPQLGLVFADDPYLFDWGLNKEFANQLAKQLALPALPLQRFNFPVGNMFWVRPQALQSLFALEWTWDHYPQEPLPLDGSILHALERLTPMIVAQQGYTQAVTYVPGVTR